MYFILGWILTIIAHFYFWNFAFSSFDIPFQLNWSQAFVVSVLWKFFVVNIFYKKGK